MELNQIVSRSHKLAKEKGWYLKERGVPELLCLIHSEISEALEAYRCGDMGIRISNSSGKPEGFDVEIADAIIRIADLCGYLSIDIERAIELKHEYNESRPHRHGNKLA